MSRLRNHETGRPPENDPAIAEFRSQLAEQKAICEGLQQDVAQKDKEINALEAEVRSVKHTLVDAEPSKIAEWRAKFENVKRLLHDTEGEVEQLKTQLKEAKDRERALQRQLDEAKDEADRRERLEWEEDSPNGKKEKEVMRDRRSIPALGQSPHIIVQVIEGGITFVLENLFFDAV
ncbi:hypothetical protein SLS54_009019 [Diplodia seriata]